MWDLTISVPTQRKMYSTRQILTLPQEKVSWPETILSFLFLISYCKAHMIHSVIVIRSFSLLLIYYPNLWIWNYLLEFFHIYIFPDFVLLCLKHHHTFIMVGSLSMPIDWIKYKRFIIAPSWVGSFSKVRNSLSPFLIILIKYWV